MSILRYCVKGFGVVRYTPKGEKPIKFNVMEWKELDTVCNLISNASPGTGWRVLCYKAPTPKKAKNKRKKMPGIHNIVSCQKRREGTV